MAPASATVTAMVTATSRGMAAVIVAGITTISANLPVPDRLRAAAPVGTAVRATFARLRDTDDPPGVGERFPCLCYVA